MATTKRQTRQDEIEQACFAHESHDDPSEHAGDCGFCAVAMQDVEHRAHLAATPDAHESTHGRFSF